MRCVWERIKCFFGKCTWQFHEQPITCRYCDAIRPRSYQKASLDFQGNIDAFIKFSNTRFDKPHD